MLRNLVYISLFSLLIAGCSSPRSVEQKLYLIQLPEQADSIRIDTTPLLAGLCQINEVNVNPVYANRLIAIRDQSHQIQYFDHHQWAVRPSELFFNVLVDFFSRQGLFQQVSGRFWQNTPGYALTTNIYTLEIENLNQNFKVHLKMEFILKDLKKNHIMINHRINRAVILKQKDLNLMASTISSILYEELKNFTLEIRSQLSPKETTSPKML